MPTCLLLNVTITRVIRARKMYVVGRQRNNYSMFWWNAVWWCGGKWRWCFETGDLEGRLLADTISFVRV